MDAKDVVNDNDRSRKYFEILARTVLKTFKSCINVPGVNRYRKDHDALNIIYKSLCADQERADITTILRELHDIVDQSVEL